MGRLLLDSSVEESLRYAMKAARALLGGKVAVSELLEGGFLKRADQRDLLRAAGFTVRLPRLSPNTGEAKTIQHGPNFSQS